MPQRHKDRYVQAQRIKPDQYKKFFDKIFEGARRNGIKVRMDLAGHPGSSSGERHGGCATGYYTGSYGSLISTRTYPEHWFFNEGNQMIAIDAMEIMAKRCVDEGETCYGVGVMNEYQPTSNEWNEF